MHASGDSFPVFLLSIYTATKVVSIRTNIGPWCPLGQNLVVSLPWIGVTDMGPSSTVPGEAAAVPRQTRMK